MSWQVDYAHTQITFWVRHMMVAKVTGQFDKFTIDIDVDEQNPENTRIEVQIEAASINTKTNDRDNHLRSADFLDAENHPYLTFKSKKLKMIDDSHAKLTGDLTIRGVSKEVTLDVEHFGQHPSPFGPFIAAGFNAHTKINRKDWGLTWNVALETGGVLVGDEITINIELELMKQFEAAKEAAATA